VKDIRPVNPLQRIKYLYLEWSWDRVLKRSGCASWESYFRKNDPDFNVHAKTVKQQFAGYPYVAQIPESRVDLVIDPWFGVIRNVETLYKWCAHNCSKKHRLEWIKVVHNQNDDWYIVDSLYRHANFAHEAHAFVGFKDERDFLIFTLKWT
jgi:hypothetical protein